MAYTFSRKPHPVPKIETAHRSIQTAIPAPGTEELLARLDAVESRSMHGQLPVWWKSANGHTVIDEDGKSYIDFTSCIFVANAGHGNAAVTKAICDAASMPHSYTFPTKARLKYLERLTEWSGFEKAFLMSSGTEATEHALRLMRLHGQKVGKRRLGIVCIEGNYHGRTLGAAMMNRRVESKFWNSTLGENAWMGKQDPDIHHIPFPYSGANTEFELAAALSVVEHHGTDLTRDVCGFMPILGHIAQDRHLTRDVCGFMLETYQGWGAIFYPPAYVKAIETMCRKFGILLCFDEMQAGFGRTGKKFGYEHYGVKPDLICVGKAMGGGVPLSGVLGSAAILDLPETGSIISTHSANPLSCAAGLAVLGEIDRLDLVNEAERKGVLLHKALAEIPYKSLGKGLIAAVHLPSAEFASRVAERCMQRGVLVVCTGRETVKIGPPLVIPDDALVEGVQVLSDAISEIETES